MASLLSRLTRLVGTYTPPLITTKELRPIRASDGVSSYTDTLATLTVKRPFSPLLTQNICVILVLIVVAAPPARLARLVLSLMAKFVLPRSRQPPFPSIGQRISHAKVVIFV